MIEGNMMKRNIWREIKQGELLLGCKLLSVSSNLKRKENV